MVSSPGVALSARHCKRCGSEHMEVAKIRVRISGKITLLLLGRDKTQWSHPVWHGGKIGHLTTKSCQPPYSFTWSHAGSERLFGDKTPYYPYISFIKDKSQRFGPNYKGHLVGQFYVWGYLIPYDFFSWSASIRAGTGQVFLKQLEVL